MNTMINDDMFAKIQESLNHNKNQGSAFKDELKCVPGNTYLVRLLPNMKNPQKTFFEYYFHGWTSVKTGKYIAEISPETFGERDPISEYQYKYFKNGTKEEKEKTKVLYRKRQTKVNVYVIDDPTNPENNGTVKILKYGKHLGDIIESNVIGTESKEVGNRAFDLSENGCTLKIIVNTQGSGANKINTYTASKFGFPGKIDGMTKEKMKEIYNSTFDLEATVSCKSYDELKEVLNEHFLGVSEDDDAPDYDPHANVTQEEIPDTIEEDETFPDIEDDPELSKIMEMDSNENS